MPQDGLIDLAKLDLFFARSEEVHIVFQQEFTKKLDMFMTFTAAGLVPVPSKESIRRDLQQPTSELC